MEGSSILGQSDRFETLVWSPAPQVCEYLVFLVQAFRRDEQRNRLALNVFGPITEHSLGPAVPGLDDAVQVLCHNSVSRKLNNRGETGSSVICLPLLGDIAENQNHSGNRTIT